MAESHIVERSNWAAGSSWIATRRRSMLLLVVVGLIALSILALAKAVPEFGRAMADLRNKAPNLMAMLDERSPGARTSAELTKLKKHRAAAASPKERALGKIFQPDQPALFKALTPLVPVATSELLNLAPLVVGPVAIPGLIVPASDIPPVVVAPPGGIVAGGGGGGGGSGGGGGGGGTGATPPPTVPTVPPAVPEPATWTTMLLGFALLGVAMRRSRTVGGALLLG